MVAIAQQVDAAWVGDGRRIRRRIQPTTTEFSSKEPRNKGVTSRQHKFFWIERSNQGLILTSYHAPEQSF